MGSMMHAVAIVFLCTCLQIDGYSVQKRASRLFRPGKLNSLEGISVGCHQDSGSLKSFKMKKATFHPGFNHWRYDMHCAHGFKRSYRGIPGESRRRLVVNRTNQATGWNGFVSNVKKIDSIECPLFFSLREFRYHGWTHTFELRTTCELTGVGRGDERSTPCMNIPHSSTTNWLDQFDVACKHEEVLTGFGIVRCGPSGAHQIGYQYRYWCASTCLPPNRLSVNGYCRCPVGRAGDPYGESCEVCQEGLEATPDQSRCEDIDECKQNNGGCDESTMCRNTQPFCACDCIKHHVLPNGETTGGPGDKCERSLDHSISSTNSKLRIDLNGNSHYVKYNITLYEWNPSKTLDAIVRGYPVTFAGKVTENPVYEAERLPAGRQFRIKIQACDDQDRWDFVKRVDTDRETYCGCDATEYDSTAELSGAPIQVKVKQLLGSMRLSWKDNSLCESGFSFTRYEVGRDDATNESFVENYYHSGGRQCGKHFDFPEAVKDELNAVNFKLGSRFRYCARALSVHGEVSRGAGCSEEVQVQWEAEVYGRIVLPPQAGGLPVAGVNITWLIGPEDAPTREYGEVSTERDGTFRFRILSSTLVAEEQRLELVLEKKTGNVTHRFLGPGIVDGSESVMYLKHLSLGHEMNFIDDTSVQFSGRVGIAGTEHHPSNGNQVTCPMAGAEVCLHDAVTGSRYACGQSNSLGLYSIPAVIGTHIRPRGSFHGSDLVLVNEPDEGYTIGAKKLWEHVDFLEQQAENLTIEVAGGKCNRYLGDATLEIRLASCHGWKKTLSMNTVRHTLVVPAHDVEVSLQHLEKEEVMDYFKSLFGADRSQKTSLVGLAARKLVGTTDQQQQDEDGIADPSLIRFEYHPQPTLKISFANNDASEHCAGGLVQHILPAHQWTTATIQVTEDFGNGIEVCDWLDGHLFITNHLGEDAEVAEQLREAEDLTDEDVSSLTACRHSCKMLLEHESKHPAIEMAECAGWKLVASTWSPFVPAGDDEEAVVNQDFEALSQFNMQDEIPALRVRHSQLYLECGTASNTGGLEGESTRTTLFQRVLDFSQGEMKVRDTLAESDIAYSGMDMSLSNHVCNMQNQTVNQTVFCEALKAGITTFAFNTTGNFADPVFDAVPSSPRCGGESTPGTWARMWVRTRDETPTAQDLPSECTGSRLRILRDKVSVAPSNAHVRLPLLTGMPASVRPYTKMFKATMAVELHFAEQKDTVLVTGDSLLSDLDTVSLPKFRPLMVVRDPPGGNSFAEYTRVTSTIDLNVSHYEVYRGWTTDVAGRLHHKFRSSQLVAVEVGTPLLSTVMGQETEVLEVDGGRKDSFHHDGMRQTRLYGKKQSHEYQLEWSYRTNRWPTLVGKDADMFLTPALNIQFREVLEISWNSTLCQAQNLTKKKYTLHSKKTGPAFTWQSYSSIKNIEIPKLEGLKLEALVKNNTEKVFELENAIQGWNDTLTRHDQTLDDATNGRLQHSKLEHLVPPSLVSGAFYMNGTEIDKDGIGALSAISRIKFYGAAGSLSYRLKEKDLDEKVSQADTPDINLKGGSSKQDLSVSLVPALHGTVQTPGFGVTFEAGSVFHRTATGSNENKKTTDDESSCGFTLSDQDVGDSFDVEVFRDPIYGSFIFVTKGGASKCPYEPDTKMREIPGILLERQPVGPVLPGEPALFELKLQNPGSEASSFEFFAQLGDNSGGARLLVDGAAYTGPRVYENIDASGFAVAVLEVFRGPEDYEYPPIKVGFRSLCESSRAATETLRFSFIEPCPAVEFAGALASDKSFLINSATEMRPDNSGELQVTARNPASARGSWSQVSRLKRIKLEYRVSGTSVWKNGINRTKLDIDAVPLETSFGFSTFWWNPRHLPEGSYELRLRAVCNASKGIADPPLGLDESLSAMVVGHIDRTPPEPFGMVEPADRELMPGDEISVSFLEQLQCDEPHRFGVSLSISGTESHLDNRHLRVLCEARKISIALPPSLPFEEVMGKQSELRIWDVEDLHGNILMAPIHHSFRFGRVSLSDAEVEVSGLALAVPFSTDMGMLGSPSFLALADDLAGDVASVSGGDRGRVRTEAIYSAIDHTVEVVLTLRSGSEPLAVEMASAIQSTIDSLNSPDASDGSIIQRRLKQKEQFRILHKATPQKLQLTLEKVQANPNIGSIWDLSDGGFVRSTILVACLLVLSFILRQLRNLKQMLKDQLKRSNQEAVSEKFDQEMGQYQLESAIELGSPAFRAPWSLEMSQDLRPAGLATSAAPAFGESKQKRHY